jgi:hypothetical protein
MARVCANCPALWDQLKDITQVFEIFADKVTAELAIYAVC